MSLRDGAAKMSKSDPSDQSRINLLDDADAIAQKIRRAKTDPLPMPETLADAEKRPDADNLLGIYAALADRERSTVGGEGAAEADVGDPNRGAERLSCRGRPEAQRSVVNPDRRHSEAARADDRVPG